MVPQTRPLIEVLAEIPDFRSPHGKRHPLGAILALACSAMLCGSRSDTAMAEWGRDYGEPLVRALGFLRRRRRVPPPCIRSSAEWIGRLGSEAWSLGRGTPGGRRLPRRARRRHGHRCKTLRGSQKQGASGAHLLSALAHHVGVTLAQQAVDDKTNEIPVALGVAASAWCWKGGS